MFMFSSSLSFFLYRCSSYEGDLLPGETCSNRGISVRVFLFPEKNIFPALQFQLFRGITVQEIENRV